MVTVRHGKGKETLWVPFVKGGRGECVVASPRLQENCYRTKYLESLRSCVALKWSFKKKKKKSIIYFVPEIF